MQFEEIIDNELHEDLVENVEPTEQDADESAELEVEEAEQADEDAAEEAA